MEIAIIVLLAIIVCFFLWDRLRAGQRWKEQSNTMAKTVGESIADTTREELLAARSIIYSKIIEKEELTDHLITFPHLRNELACIRTTKQLSVDDCRRLFPLVRRTKSSDARQIVAEYLARIKPRM